MTYEEWRATRDDVRNLFLDNDTAPEESGYMYIQGSWIADLDGEYYTIVGNEECWSKDLAIVEQFLWDNWAEGEYNGN